MSFRAASSNKVASSIALLGQGRNGLNALLQCTSVGTAPPASPESILLKWDGKKLGGQFNAGLGGRWVSETLWRGFQVADYNKVFGAVAVNDPVIRDSGTDKHQHTENTAAAYTQNAFTNDTPTDAGNTRILRHSYMPFVLIPHYAAYVNAGLILEVRFQAFFGGDLVGQTRQLFCELLESDDTTNMLDPGSNIYTTNPFAQSNGAVTPRVFVDWSTPSVENRAKTRYENAELSFRIATNNAGSTGTINLHGLRVEARLVSA